MKKILSLMLMSVLILVFAGCGTKGPVADKAKVGITSEPKQSQTTDGPQKPNKTASGSKTLPASYPKEILPLAVDAEIIDVRENPASKGLEVMYVSDNDIDMLCDFYEGALKGAKDLNTDETPDGYWITAKMGGVDYTIMLDKNAMNPNPQYAGKISAYIILTGLEGISGGVPQMPEGEGEAWPSADLPGVPELKGHISKILREDDIIHFEMTVESVETIKRYIGELTASGFSFDSQPDADSDHVQFLAFKDNNMLNFAFKSQENRVFIEYQK